MKEQLRPRQKDERAIGPRWIPLPRTASAIATVVLSLQRDIGNRVVADALMANKWKARRAPTDLLVQRRHAQDLIDKRITIFSIPPAVVDDELVPLGEAPGRFDGFRAEQGATELAERAAEVSILMRDTDGHFHVLRTNQTSLRKAAAPPQDPIGWRIERIIVPAGGAREDNWKVMLHETKNAAPVQQPGAYVPGAYIDLLSRWTHLAPTEIAWAKDAKNVVPGKVNITTWLTASGRTTPDKVVPTGDMELPVPTVLINTTTFNQGPVAVRGTLLHEYRHAYHGAQTIDLVRRWRKVRRQDTPGAWQAWLKGQKGNLPEEVYLTSWANTDPQYGTATTETYSHVQAFLYEYQRLELAGLDPDLMTKIQTRDLHWTMARLNILGEHWEAAAQDTKDKTILQIATFLKGLSSNHRKNVLHFINVQLKGLGQPPKYFYNKIRERL
ncbi:MAG: hypothetical protein ACRDTA_02995 [Pseudonocardiaceae bacterium]